MISLDPIYLSRSLDPAMQLLFMYLNVWILCFRYIIFVLDVSALNIMYLINNKSTDVVLLVELSEK